VSTAKKIKIEIKIKQTYYKTNTNHVNGKIAQLKQQIAELGFLVVLHFDIYRQCALQIKFPLLTFAVLIVRFCHRVYKLSFYLNIIYHHHHHHHHYYCVRHKVSTETKSYMPTFTMWQHW